ncbi:hypothetical protein DRH29_03035 [candidate division Kazan bacterium]|uniref:Phage tail protein n=1 Tax=candidate division Kazan bacterium TaxID=2202143 RepID=A0A420ZCL7_UNCK3|nr:MAG: hypothetical protein DRH29_03035 [candidate division Kazan bacterium]
MSSDVENRTWKTRIKVLISHTGSPYPDIEYEGTTSDGGNEVLVEIVENVSDAERSVRDIIHSTHQWNQGTVVRPHEFSWTLEVLANTQAAKLLRHLQRDNKYFRLYLEEDIPDELPDQFVYETEILGDAWVEDRRLTVPNIGVARVVFSGRALRAAYAGGSEYGEYPYY